MSFMPPREMGSEGAALWVWNGLRAAGNSFSFEGKSRGGPAAVPRLLLGAVRLSVRPCWPWPSVRRGEHGLGGESPWASRGPLAGGAFCVKTGEMESPDRPVSFPPLLRASFQGELWARPGCAHSDDIMVRSDDVVVRSDDTC